MRKRLHYAVWSLIVLVLLLCLGSKSVQAESYTDWSEWSTQKPTGTHAQTETRKVASTYHMVVYYTQEAKSPYYRNIRDYSIGGDYAKYGARSTYGEFHYTRTMTAKEFASAKQYKNGAWIQQGTNGNTSAYHRGNGTAYQLGDMAWFVESIDYVTEYRYRDIRIFIPKDPVFTDLPVVNIPAPTPTPTPAPTPTPSPTLTPGSDAAAGKTTEITGTKCTESGIQITWKAVSGVTGYYVYRNGKKIATVTGSGTHTYLDKKAKKNGKAYKYTVCIYVKIGGSITTGKKCKETVVVYLTANLSPKATGGDGTVKVTWKPNKKCMGYEIWYSTGKKFKNYKKAIVKGSGSKSKKLTGLEGDTVYYIKIRVYYIVNGVYSYSPFCQAIRIKTPARTYLYKGVVSNAQDGAKLKNVKLNFRQGSSNKTGSVYKSCKTDSKGRYKVRLPKGTYTVEVQGKNYVTIYLTIYIYIDSPSYESNPVSISKPLSSNEYRIVLTWGAVPADLDAHLTGPSNAYGGRYHVFFRQKNGYSQGRLVANLDVDDTTSYGPETVTINVSVQKNGTYHYYVHDYTNRSLSASSALGNSGACVMVYNGNKHIATYKVPKKAGTAWHVFTIQNGKLVKKNIMSYVHDAAAFR